MTANPRACALCLLLAASACGSVTEPFLLEFPSRRAFDDVETAEVFALPVENGDVCPDILLQEAEFGEVRGAQRTGNVPVTDFERGMVRLPDVPEGAIAYAAVALAGSQVLLTGCIVRNVYRDSTPLVISLVPTEEYRTRIEGER
ncbi:MAG: hypothetical protein AAF411_10105 [Myxococcota bacterium]